MYLKCSRKLELIWWCLNLPKIKRFNHPFYWTNRNPLRSDSCHFTLFNSQIQNHISLKQFQIRLHLQKETPSLWSREQVVNSFMFISLRRARPLEHSNQLMRFSLKFGVWTNSWSVSVRSWKEPFVSLGDKNCNLKLICWLNQQIDSFS